MNTDSRHAPVSVIILNWNGASMLRRYLPHVLANTDPALGEVIVADNGSTDGSIDLLACEFPEVRVLRLDRNYGFAEGYNRAIAMVDTEFVVLLNSDVRPSPGWLAPLLEHMRGNPSTGACQPKILSDLDTDSFEYAGACGGFLDCNGYPYCRGRIFDTIEYDRGQYDTVMSVDWASGAALMVRREVYENAGGLDAAFFAHMEEIDLCWRIRLAGMDVCVVPQSIVYHLGGGTLPQGNPRKVYLNFRNNLLLLHKNLPVKVRGRRLLIRRLYDTLAWGMFLLKFDWKSAGAVLRAHRDFRRMRSGYYTYPAGDLLSGHRNIILDYYLKGKKKYSDL
ncbi:glycosyltransferase family 2 protein [uncultured Muribaculum sp.]|uniref:glycosyltransferase family 2 protein n=1 Tax=uncultured Muribaculum sp. TaxID=1918613 RepID=UPI0025ECCC20|nr:glycosyltransferase family 2 protein [uncultured Muribaculum sp.]